MRKSKKLLAFLTALSISASAFAGLGATAFAEGEDAGTWTAPQYSAGDAVHSNSAITATDATVKVGGTEYAIKVLGSISGGIDGASSAEYNGQSGGTATFTVTAETAGEYDVTVTGRGASSRRVDLAVSDTVYSFATDTESEYASQWTVISDAGESRNVFTYTFEGVALAAGENSIAVGTKVNDSWAPDVVGVDVTVPAPLSDGITYKNGKATVKAADVQTAQLIYAQYYSNGALELMKAYPLTFDENGIATQNLTDVHKGSKLMVWETLEGMTPICGACPITTGSDAETAPTVAPKPTATPGADSTPAPTSEPTQAPTPKPTAKPTADPALTIYSQDYEDITDASTVMTSQNAQGNVKIGTDKTNYLQYEGNSSTNSRSSYSDFTVVDLGEETKYVTEFDAALTSGNRDAAQFVVRTGDIPAANTGYDSTYIFKLDIPAGSTTYKINDVDANTVNLTAGAWYHYKLYVDSEDELATLTITDSTNVDVIDKLIVPVSNPLNIKGLYWLNGRYSNNFKIDNILVRKVDEAIDEFGEQQEETLSKVEFTSQLNRIISQPAEDTPVHAPIAIKATGIYGGDLTDKINVEWSTLGLAKEDGYISLTTAEGTGAGTEGTAPGDKDTTVYFNVRNGVSSYFGNVTAKVTYLDEEMTISTPFAVISAETTTNIAPAAGYYLDMSDYSDELVGYKATATGLTDRDLVLNNWSVYGSNGSRGITLEKDEDGTKYLRFASNGGGGSTVGMYQLEDQANQYIVDMKVRFTGGDMTFGHYFNSANNKDGNPSWTASYAGGALKLGAQSISGLNTTDWFRVVISADESTKTTWAKVYNNAGTLLGSVDAESINTAVAVDKDGNALESGAEAYSLSQKYFCLQGTYPVDIASFKIYYPTAASLVVNGAEGVIQVPEADTAVTEDLTAVLNDLDGFNMTGTITWSLAEDYTGVTLTSTGAQTAKLAVDNTAGAGTIIVVATNGAARVEKEITLSTSGNSMVFTKRNSSLTIPFEGENDITADFAAEVRNKDGEAISTDSGVTLSLVDEQGNIYTNEKITFENGTLTVKAGAPSKTLYIKADAAVTTDGETENLSSRVKVAIHGLSFSFGTDDPEDESFTKVTSDDAYSDSKGYGFADTSAVADAAANISGSKDYRFKAKVPNGNYTVQVETTSTLMTSEVVETVSVATGISKSGSQFEVAVCDGVLDLTFASGSKLTSLVISQSAPKASQAKPSVYAIGDSTTSNNANGNVSWGNKVGSGVTLPDVFSTFANYGWAGKNGVSFYNLGSVERVLLAICPGDYVTVNMGINSESGANESAYYELQSKYYVQAIIDRGAIPVLLTATPDGPTWNGERTSYNWGGNYTNGKFTNNRGTGARNGIWRRIAQEKQLNIVELGYYFEDYFNKLTMDDVAAYNTKDGTNYQSVPEMVANWYGDHNHYRDPLASLIGQYILDSVAEIHNGSDAFNYANDPHINEQ